MVIPALNEAESIGAVVRLARNFGQPVVIDDGSADETGRLAKEAGAIVVRHEVNQGYDTALAAGFRLAVDRNFQYVITLDGDGQHNPDGIREFIRILDSGADLVVGVRGRRQRYSEVLFSLCSSLLWSVKDPLCGMKGYRVSKLRELPSLSSYPSVGTEITIRAIRMSWRISQTPIHVAPRKGLASRFGEGHRANMRILRALASGLVKAR